MIWTLYMYNLRVTPVPWSGTQPSWGVIPRFGWETCPSGLILEKNNHKFRSCPDPVIPNTIVHNIHNVKRRSRLDELPIGADPSLAWKHLRSICDCLAFAPFEHHEIMSIDCHCSLVLFQWDGVSMLWYSILGSWTMSVGCNKTPPHRNNKSWLIQGSQGI